MAEKEENFFHSDKRFGKRRNGLQFSHAEPSDCCGMLSICVQTLNVDDLSLYSGLPASAVLCVDADFLLGITTAKRFK